MKRFIITFYLLSLGLYAQEVPSSEFDSHTWQAPYDLNKPKDWGVERFAIPISFAPQIDYKGIEDIRFTPGWAKSTSEEYWSYAFLWYLDGEINLDIKKLESNLQAYYSGLISANGSKIPKEKLIAVVASFKETQKDKDDKKTFSGTIKMLDYMKQVPITLHCKVHLRSCSEENKTIIFYELSPQPYSHKTWINLDKLWSDLKCKKD